MISRVAFGAIVSFGGAPKAVASGVGNWQSGIGSRESGIGERSIESRFRFPIPDSRSHGTVPRTIWSVFPVGTTVSTTLGFPR
jgi:hypothetical protein